MYELITSSYYAYNYLYTAHNVNIKS